MTKNRSSQKRAKLPWLRTAASVLLLLAVLVASSCGSSHRTDTRGATTSRRTTKRHTVPTEPKYSHLALISARSGKILRLSDLDLRSAVSDGRDGWFVVGDIGLAHLLPNGKLDSAWGTRESRNLGRCISCQLVKSGSRLYLAGSRFEAVSGMGEARVAVVEAFDATTGARLWVGPAPSQDVDALAVSSTHVYVGGAFTEVGNAKRQGLAALDTKTGRLLDWRGPRLRFDPENSAFISALTLAGSRLYVGGLFSSIGGKQQYYLAALNPSTGALLSWKPPKAAFGAYYPLQIVIARGQLIVPGYDGFSATSLHTGHALSWPSRIEGGGADSLALDGPLLYLGANIENTLRSVDGASRNNLAVFNLATGRFADWAPDLAPYVTVVEIAPSGDQVLVVGDFTDSIG